jgi:hypothetical protein
MFHMWSVLMKFYQHKYVLCIYWYRRDRMVVGFTYILPITAKAVSSYPVLIDTTLCHKDCQ